MYSEDGCNPDKVAAVSSAPRVYELGVKDGQTKSPYPDETTHGLLGFSDALIYMKAGHKVCRQAWFDEWVCLADGFDALPAEKFWNKHTNQLATLNGGSANVKKYFLFVNTKKEVQMGWTPTQEDMLAMDWIVIS